MHVQGLDHIVVTGNILSVQFRDPDKFDRGVRVSVTAVNVYGNGQPFR